MGRNETRRSIGTLLMGIGLLLILSVAGYFAWTEVQAGQVRDELEQSAAAASARATRMEQESPQGPTTPAVVAAEANSAQTAAAAKSALSATPRTILPEITDTPTRRATATRTPARRATAVGKATAGPKPTSPAAAAEAAMPIAALADSPTEAPAAIVAPVLPVRLAIPDLKIDTKVVEMGWQSVQTKNGPISEWVIPKNTAGHHLNSAALGQPDNLVISGHNNIFGRVFMPISQAWDNDHRKKVDDFADESNVLDGRELLLYDAAGKAYTYVITDFYRLKDTGVSRQQRVANGRFILPTGDERVTIVTCWPPTNNTHRLVVIARPEK